MKLTDLNLPVEAQNVLIRMLTSQGVEIAEVYDLIREYAKLFPLDSEMPPVDEMEHLLDRDGAILVIPAERVAREWCTLKIRDTAAYHIIHYLGVTDHPPSEEAIHAATTELISRVDIEDDPPPVKELMAMTIRSLKNVTPDEVGHVWMMCQTYGILPWPLLDTPLLVPGYSRHGKRLNH